MKVPVQMIIGDKEVEANTINVRRYGSRKQDPYNLDDYIEILLKEVSSKA